ncbi:MAG TPA: NAD(P)/FAD-dependent oxidoreductase [Vicinamibacterales bacterium]|nr:NAD(P)/FAD-dependent oxidoreductase [Vicinamibacterales bacterium]
MLETDILVIGSGPAGSAAALAGVRHGLRVVLVDSHVFPRDKACGDALIPDALQALGDLGLRERVLSVSHRIDAVRIYAPGGRHTTLYGECACVLRAVFDDVLRSAAVDAGATFVAPARALVPLERNGIVVGARFACDGGSPPLEVAASTTILATGAASDVLERFGMCVRTAPSAAAARQYVQVDERAARDHDFLCVAYAAGVCPGYGWLFPGPGGVFNVGVGYAYDAPPRERNIRRLLERFLTSFPPAIELMRAAISVGPLKGAPLRMAMKGARLSRPGLLVVGEAAGLTYSFSGEGIGKALQSGILAANAATSAGEDPGMAAETYAAQLFSSFTHRFRAYARLQRLVASPTIANALIWRANSGTYVQRQLEALLNEAGTGKELVTVPGMIRAVFT